MTNHRETFRKKMCDDCAFRKGAEETNTQAKRDEFYFSCHTKYFFCHKTMYDKKQRKQKFEGCYDPDRKPDGSPATLDDHQLCAGFVMLHGEDIGIKEEKIKEMCIDDIEIHAYFGNR